MTKLPHQYKCVIEMTTGDSILSIYQRITARGRWHLLDPFPLYFPSAYDAALYLQRWTKEQHL